MGTRAEAITLSRATVPKRSEPSPRQEAAITIRSSITPKCGDKQICINTGMTPLLILGLLAAIICGCNACPDLSAVKVDSNGYISWDDAQKIIVGCDVHVVSQSHALVVGITLKDGREFRAVEPKIDDAWNLIKKHGLQKKIEYATE